MTNTQTLIAAVHKAHPTLSQNKVAELLGRSKQTVSNWTTGTRQIEHLEIVAEICLAAGLPTGEWVARFGTEAATSRKAAAWWQNIAKVACIALAVYTANSKANTPYPENMDYDLKVRNLYIMSNYLRSTLR